MELKKKKTLDPKRKALFDLRYLKVSMDSPCPNIAMNKNSDYYFVLVLRKEKMSNTYYVSELILKKSIYL